MSKELKLVSPIPPSNNHYLGYRASRGIVIPYPTKETREYKKEFIPYVKNEVKKQKWDIDHTGLQHYYSDWIVYFPRVDMDASNYDKVLSDSITESKSVWIDDNIVLNRIKHIYYDSKDPRIELTIHPVEYIGIFNDRSELEQFEDRCKMCNRYKRNCSILKKAKEGRIQDEINNLECLKFKEVKI